VSTQGSPQDPAGRRNGLAVNEYATELEQDLLFWNGVDVVNADLTEFAGDLLHCAAHLRKGVPFTRGGICNA